MALPISTVIATAIILLLIFTGVTTQGARSLIRRSYTGLEDAKISFSLISYFTDNTTPYLRDRYRYSRFYLYDSAERPKLPSRTPMELAVL